MATRLHPSAQRTLNPNFGSVPTLVANVGITGLTLDAGSSIITADPTSPYSASSLHVRPVTTFRATIHGDVSCETYHGEIEEDMSLLSRQYKMPVLDTRKSKVNLSGPSFIMNEKPHWTIRGTTSRNDVANYYRRNVRLCRTLKNENDTIPFILRVESEEQIPDYTEKYDDVTIRATSPAITRLRQVQKVAACHDHELP
ncbi:unnamed protein product [Orchesella dallaii]|uniref:Uncharacterized protein n=1 Tax=Orchesella dallaii TaxID=48710 RepID=A0ABP1PSC0_9HEXA